MRRILQTNHAPVTDITGVVPVISGGTGTSDGSVPPPVINGISINRLGAPLGVAQLDETGKIKTTNIPASVASPTLQGTISVIVGTSNNYIITNYDAFTTYSVAVSAGTVSRVNEVITLIAPSSGSSVTLTVNGKIFNIAVIAYKPATPSISTPVNNAVGLKKPVTVTSTAFSMLEVSDTHKSTDWQVATDTGFTNIVAQSAGDIVNRTAWSVADLATSTSYYVRCRHHSTTYDGVSEWSTASKFTTASSFAISSEQAKLVAADGAADDRFGYSVSISGDGSYVVIGACFDDDKGTDSGSAYIYTRSGTTWTQQAKLVAADGATNDLFGYSVSISGDGSYVVIGACFDDDKGTDSGSAYIYTRSGTTWTQQAKLVPADGAVNDYFGYSVSISGDGSYVVIGACFDDDKGTDSGSAYIYTRSGTTWTQQAKLVAADGATNDLFGYSVSISGDGLYVVIGAYRDDAPSTDSGSAYIYTRSGTTWTQQAKLVPADGAANDNFGISVSISGDGSYVVIGAYASDDKGTDSGSAYIYTRSGTTWAQQAKLVAADGAVNDQFGYSVSISGDGLYVVIGAYRDDAPSTDSGSAYIYTRSGTTWTQQAKLVPADGAANDNFGISVSISGDGGYVVIGARLDDDKGGDSGSAYIFN